MIFIFIPVFVEKEDQHSRNAYYRNYQHCPIPIHSTYIHTPFVSFTGATRNAWSTVADWRKALETGVLLY